MSVSSLFAASLLLEKVLLWAFKDLKTLILLDLNQKRYKNVAFLKIFLQNICKKRFFALPLHPLSRTNETSSKMRLGSARRRTKKEFFEKIYINKQVVQEVSLTLFIMCRFG